MVDSVDLTGICEIAIDQIGPSGGNSHRSDHHIYIDGTQIKDCGYVNPGNTQTCYIDVQPYTGMHSFKIRWDQRTGDNLGNSVLDHLRVTNSISTAPTGITASQDTVCPGDNITLSVNGGMLGVGGTWAWYGGSCGGSSAGTGNSITVTLNSDSTFHLRAEGGCDDTTVCVSKDLYVKNASTPPDSVIASPSSVCIGDSTTLYRQGGSLTPGASFEWYSGTCGGTPIGSGDSVTLGALANIDVYVRAEGSCGNSSCVSKSVDIDSLPSVDAGLPDTTCGGDTTQLGGEPTASGGTPPYTYSWTPSSDLNNPSTADPIAETLTGGQYRVTVMDSNGCSSSDTTFIFIDDPFCGEAHIFIPNAFSPNGDGRNDELRVRGKGIASFELVIFNRWGEKVFTTSSKNEGWDGRYGGEAAATGVYAYKVSGSFVTGGSIEKKGNITLLR